MSNDEDILAQIANIEAQMSFQQQQPQQAAWQTTSTFGGAPSGLAAQGFPQRATPYGGPAGAPQNAAAAASGHQFSKDTDDRSVFIGNLPKGQNGIVTTPEELAAFFQECGPMLNVTVLKDKATGELKGTAYIEFATHEACGRAIDTKNNANFKGCQISVGKKRSLYRPGVVRGAAGGARGGRGGRGGMFQADPMQAMMAIMAMSAGMQQFMGGRGGGRGGRGGRGRGGAPGGGPGFNEGGFQPFQ